MTKLSGDPQNHFLLDERVWLVCPQGSAGVQTHQGERFCWDRLVQQSLLVGLRCGGIGQGGIGLADTESDCVPQSPAVSMLGKRRD